MTLQDERLAFSWRAGDEIQGRIGGRCSLFRVSAHERDKTRGTRGGYVYDVGVASDGEVDCSCHFGAKPPTHDARLACRLLGGVEKQADVAPPALGECSDAGIGELPRGNELEVSSRSVTVHFVGDGGRPFPGADEEGIDGTNSTRRTALGGRGW